MRGESHGLAVRSIALICAGALVSPLDSAVNIAFPAIVAAFAVEPRDIQWVVITFVIAQSLASITFGRIGDLYGHRRVFAAGLIGCALTHWLVAESASFVSLVLNRALQGGAVGVAVACAPALIASAAGPSRTARMLAVYSAAISAGFMMGPLAGGWLVQQLGWAGVFLFRVVLAILVLALMPRWLHGSAGLSLVDPSERRLRRPPVAWAVMLSRPFLSLQAAALVIYMTTFSILLCVPFLLSDWPELSLSAAGAVLAAFPMGSFVASLFAARGPWPPGGQYSRRWIHGGLAVAALGLGATAAGAWLLTSVAALAATLFLCGVGLGGFQAGYMEQTMRWLPADNAGIAGSLLTFVRLVGLVLGVPVLSALGAHAGLALTLAASAGLLAIWALGYRGGQER